MITIKDLGAWCMPRVLKPIQFHAEYPYFVIIKIIDKDKINIIDKSGTVFQIKKRSVKIIN